MNLTKRLYGAASTGAGQSLAALEDPGLFYVETDDLINLPALWTGDTNGAAAATGVSTYGEADGKNAIGVMSVDSGTTATGRACLHKGSFLLGKQAIRLKMRVALETLGNAGEDFTIYIGLLDQLAADGDPNNGVFFRYNYNEFGGNWALRSADSGGAVLLNSAIPADVNYHIFEIIINAAGTTADFYIDGVFRSQIAASIPKTGNRRVSPAMKIQKVAGLTARRSHLDFYMLKATRSTPR